MKQFSIRIVLGIVCLYHLCTGLLMTLSQSSAEWLGRIGFGLNEMPGAAAMPIIRMLGAYMLLAGVLLALVIWQPVRHRAVLSALAGLVVLRSLQRLIYADELAASLGIAASRNRISITVLSVMAIALVGCRLLLQKEKSE